jgi:hypothetical protein
MARISQSGSRFLLFFRKSVMLTGTMDPEFDFDHLAQDLPAEARGLTRQFFAAIRADHKRLLAALRRLREDKSGNGKIASRRRAKRFRVALAGRPCLLEIKSWYPDLWQLLVVMAANLDRTPWSPYSDYSEPTISIISIDMMAGAPTNFMSNTVYAISGHAVGRWFERAAPSDLRATNGLFHEMGEMCNNNLAALRIIGSQIRDDLVSIDEDDRIGIPSASTGGAWVATTRKFKIDLGGVSLDMGIFLHTYLGPNELSTGQVENIEALEEFFKKNASLLHKDAEEWPAEKKYLLLELNDPAIWEPKSAA